MAINGKPNQKHQLQDDALKEIVGGRAERAPARVDKQKKDLKNSADKFNRPTVGRE
ncbi:hypothetical protein ACNVED_05970 [Legionella sp. D16C41]|uniref:hypothetical protein n=1 Tax=Legionella sp. D16C41 TaxID=3402688 RepID=UPI003AF72C5A